MDFENCPPFEACFHATITGNFERFRCLTTWKQILLKTQTSFKRLNKMKAGQIEWGVQNAPITKNGF